LKGSHVGIHICRKSKDCKDRRWRKIHNEELYNSHFSSNIVRMMKLRTMIWAGYVARMEVKRNAYVFRGESQEDKALEVSGKIILN
jgi:hypothetical protein